MDNIAEEGLDTQRSENGILSTSSGHQNNQTHVNFNVPEAEHEHAPVTEQASSTQLVRENDSQSRVCKCCSNCSKSVVLACFKKCLDSLVCSFSFGAAAVICGIVVIAISTQSESQNQYFIIGPILLVLGVILVLRGCIHLLVKRQDQEEENARQRRGSVDEERRAITRAQRVAEIEEAVISEDNVMIPPNYSLVADSRPRGINRMMSTASQTEYNLNETSSLNVMSTQTSGNLNRPRVSMVSIAVDTSDLPPDLESPVYQPPSYDTLQPEKTEASIVTVYLPED